VIVIPAALAQAMEYRKLSVRSLAKMVGVKHATIGHLRTGYRRNCKTDVANRIAEAVQMPLDFLFVVKPSNVSQDGRRAA